MNEHEENLSKKYTEFKKEIFDHAYGWTIHKDGYIAGLTAGDMGFEWNDLKLHELVDHAYIVGQNKDNYYRELEIIFSKFIVDMVLYIEKYGENIDE